MKILVIEDDPAVAAFEKDILSDHDVTIAVDMHDAITVAMTEDWSGKPPFELIVLDLKLPKKHQPGEFHKPEEIIKLAHERFPTTPIVVISAFLDDDNIQAASKLGMFCIGKSHLNKTSAFLNLFTSVAEASKIMRGTMLQHLTVDAVKAASCPPDRSTSETDRTKAILYLMAGGTVILLPWALIGFQMYLIGVLHEKETLIPYYTQILGFCGLALASILGILPWLLKFYAPQLERNNPKPK